MVVRLGYGDNWPRLKHWSREEYHRLAEAGVFDNVRVQLIAGEIVEMTPQRNEHAVGIGLVDEALRKAFGAGHWVRAQMPLVLSADSEPEPDLAVVTGSPRDYQDHPTTALLIVEISDTTLAYDTNQKARLYASASIEDYWVLDLVHRTLIVHRNPAVGSEQGFEWKYARIMKRNTTETIAPLARPDAVIRVADLFPDPSS